MAVCDPTAPAKSSQRSTTGDLQRGRNSNRHGRAPAYVAYGIPEYRIDTLSTRRRDWRNLVIPRPKPSRSSNRNIDATGRPAVSATTRQGSKQAMK